MFIIFYDSKKLCKVIKRHYPTQVKLKHVNVIVPECSEYNFVLWVNDLSFIVIKENFVTSITKLTYGDKIAFKALDIEHIL